MEYFTTFFLAPLLGSLMCRWVLIKILVIMRQYFMITTEHVIVNKFSF